MMGRGVSVGPGGCITQAKLPDLRRGVRSNGNGLICRPTGSPLVSQAHLGEFNHTLVDAMRHHGDLHEAEVFKRIDVEGTVFGLLWWKFVAEFLAVPTR